MSALWEAAMQGFLPRALAAGLLLSAVCPLLGVLLVQRGMAFLSDGLAHAAFGGIALALLLGTGVDGAFWVATPFTVLAALLIVWLRHGGRLQSDTAIGVVFTLALAAGVVFLALRPADAPAVDIEALLVGDLRAVTPSALVLVGLVAAVTAAVMAAVWGDLAYIAFDDELAALSGVRVRAREVAFMALCALVVVVTVKTAGVILASAFMIVPAATAMQFPGNLAVMTGRAMGVSLLGVVVGLAGSYWLDAPSGATIVLTLGLGFALAARYRR